MLVTMGVASGGRGAVFPWNFILSTYIVDRDLKGYTFFMRTSKF